MGLKTYVEEIFSMSALKKFFDEYVRDVTSLGGLPLYFVLFLYFALSANYKIALNLAEIFVIIMVITYAIKTVYFKPRPDNNSGKKGKTLFDKADLASFPSVHAARITALGVFFSLAFQAFAVTILSAILILAVCISRVVLNRHYAADVAAGFIFGFLVGYAVFVFL